MMIDRDREGQKLLHFDAIAEVEKISGKRMDYEDKGTGLSAVLMMRSNGARKEAHLKRRKDTHFGMSWDDMIAFLKRNKYERVYYGEAIEPKEREAIYVLRSKGILFYTTSYDWTGVNTANAFFEFRFNSKEEYRMCDLRATNGPVSMVNLMQRTYDLDCREGFLSNMLQLEGRGEFITPWTDKKHRPYLCTHAEVQGENWMDEIDKIRTRKMAAAAIDFIGDQT